MSGGSSATRGPVDSGGEDRKLRWGVLGCARIASKALLPAMSRSRNGELTALASRDLERAQAVAEEYAIPTACSPYDRVLEDPSVEAVYIPLPNDMHREWALRAIEAGLGNADGAIVIFIEVGEETAESQRHSSCDRTYFTVFRNV